jgi:hypothetical protein
MAASHVRGEPGSHDKSRPTEKPKLGELKTRSRDTLVSWLQTVPVGFYVPPRGETMQMFGGLCLFFFATQVVLPLCGRDGVCGAGTSTYDARAPVRASRPHLGLVIMFYLGNLPAAVGWARIGPRGGGGSGAV